MICAILGKDVQVILLDPRTKVNCVCFLISNHLFIQALDKSRQGGTESTIILPALGEQQEEEAGMQIRAKVTLREFSNCISVSVSISPVHISISIAVYIYTQKVQSNLLK